MLNMKNLSCPAAGGQTLILCMKEYFIQVNKVGRVHLHAGKPIQDPLISNKELNA
jgi:hypothetical protein